MTPRRTTYLDPKGRGNNSLLIKQGTAEDVYAVALQRLSDSITFVQRHITAQLELASTAWWGD